MAVETVESYFEIAKGELKSDLKNRLLNINPSHIGKLKESILQRVYAYYKGYAKALSEYAQLPLNKKEIRSLLCEEALKFAIEEIEKD